MYLQVLRTGPEPRKTGKVKQKGVSITHWSLRQFNYRIESGPKTIKIATPSTCRVVWWEVVSLLTLVQLLLLLLDGRDIPDQTQTEPAKSRAECSCYLTVSVAGARSITGVLSTSHIEHFLLLRRHHLHHNTLTFVLKQSQVESMTALRKWL